MKRPKLCIINFNYPVYSSGYIFYYTISLMKCRCMRPSFDVFQFHILFMTHFMYDIIVIVFFLNCILRLFIFN